MGSYKNKRNRQLLAQAVMLSLAVSSPYAVWAEEAEEEEYTYSLTDSSYDGILYGSSSWDSSNFTVLEGQKVYVKNSSVSAVMGAFTWFGSANSNEVTVDGSTVAVSVIGGFAYNTDSSDVTPYEAVDGKTYEANNNTVSILGASVIQGEGKDDEGNWKDYPFQEGGYEQIISLYECIYGGYSYGEGSVANNNYVYINITGDADAEGDESSDADSSDDDSLEEESVDPGIYDIQVIAGGSAYYRAEENTVEIAAGSIEAGSIYGGTGTGTEGDENSGGFNNKVLITGGEISADQIDGANFVYGTVSGNSVVITGGTVAGSTYDDASYIDGATVVYGDAASNSIEITGGTVSAYYLEGAYSEEGKANSNTVTITGGTVTANYYIYGGEGTYGAAYNTVTIGSADTGEDDGTENSDEDTLVVTGGYYGTYGGSSAYASANYNSVNIYSGTVTTYGIYGGLAYQLNNSDNDFGAYGNSVNIAGGSVTNSSDDIYGGFAYFAWLSTNETDTATASGNSINISGGTLSNSAGMLGGYAGYGYYSAVASENKINITGGEISSNSYMYGGYAAGIYRYGTYYYYSQYAQADKNEIDISGVTATVGSVYGGYAYVAKTAIEASENKVTITDATVTGSSMYGGYAYYSYGANAVQANVITISGSKVSATGSICGGYAYYGKTSIAASASNGVKITDGSTVSAKYVYGGQGAYGSTTENYVDVYDSDATVTYYLAGGYGYYAATENKVNIYSSNVSAYYIIGGYSNYEDATSNVITVAESETGDASDFAVSGYIFGGYSDYGAAKENTVAISAGAVTSGAIYGGYANEAYSDSTDFQASSNTVAISGGKVATSGGILGGYAYINNTGASATTSASSNVISVSDSAYVENSGGSLYGGYAAFGYYSTAASGNTVKISGGSLKNSGGIYGGYTYGTYSETTGRGSNSSTQYYYTSYAETSSNAVEISGGEVENTSTISSYSSSNFYGISIAGGYATYGSVSAAASNNSVTVSGGSLKNSGSIHGGFVYQGGSSSDESASASVSENTIAISDGTVECGVDGFGTALAGGFAYTSYSTKASSNVITISGGSVTLGGGVYGGVAYLGTGSAEATENKVEITGGTITQSSSETTDVYGIYGGFTALSTSGSSSAAKNSVSISGASVTSDHIFGGYAWYGSASTAASENAVTISEEENGEDTEVIVSGTISGGYVIGYYGSDVSAYAAASGNTVTISGGTVSAGSGIVGGYGTYAQVTGNVVTVSGGNAEASYFAGGYSAADNACGNELVISGGTVNASNYLEGGVVYDLQQSSASDESAEDAYEGASYNKVTITGGDIGTRSVYGGWVYSSSAGDSISVTASGNAVSVSGASLDASGNMYGGYAARYVTDDTEEEVTASALSNSVTLAAAESAESEIAPASESDGETSVTVDGNVIAGYALSRSYEADENTDEDNEEVAYENAASAGADASSNSVTVSDSNVTVSGRLIGGEAVAKAERSGSDSESAALGASASATANYNTVTISAGTFYGDVIGGLASTEASADGDITMSATASYNVVTLYGGTFSGTVYGGYVEAAEAADSATVSLTATGNTVIVNGGADISAASLYGANIYTEDEEEDDWENQLIVEDGVNVTQGVYNFDTIYFERLSVSDDDPIAVIATDAADNIGSVYVYVTEGNLADNSALTEAESGDTDVFSVTLADSDSDEAVTKTYLLTAEDRDAYTAAAYLGKVTVSDNIIEEIDNGDSTYAVETNVSCSVPWITGDRTEGGLYINAISSEPYCLTDGEDYLDADGNSTETTDINIGIYVEKSVIAAAFVDEDGSTVYNSGESASDIADVSLTVDDAFNSYKSSVYAGAYAAANSADDVTNDVSGASLYISSSYTGTYAGTDEDGDATVYANAKAIYAGYSEDGVVSASSIELDSAGVTALYADLYGSNSYTAYDADSETSGNSLVITGGLSAVGSVNNFNTVSFDLGEASSDGALTAGLVAVSSTDGNDGAENIGAIEISAAGSGIVAADRAASTDAEDIVTLATVTVSDNILYEVTNEDGSYNISTTLTYNDEWIAGDREEGALYINKIASVSEDGYYLTEGTGYALDDGSEIATTDINIGAYIEKSVIAAAFIDTDGELTLNSEDSAETIEGTTLAVDEAFNSYKSTVYAGAYDVSESGAGIDGASVYVSSGYTGTYSESDENGGETVYGNAKEIYAGYSENGSVKNSSITLDSAGVTALYADLYGSNAYSEDAGNSLVVTGGANVANSIGNFNTLSFDLASSSADENGVLTASLVAADSAQNIGAIVIGSSGSNAASIAAADRTAGETSQTIAKVTVSDNIYEEVGSSDISTTIDSDGGWIYSDREAGGLYINNISDVSISIDENGSTVAYGDDTCSDTTDIYVGAVVNLSVIAEKFVSGSGESDIVTATEELVVDDSLNEINSSVIAGVFASGENTASGGAITVDGSYAGETSVYAGYSEEGAVTDSSITLSENAEIAKATLYGYNDEAAANEETGGNTLIVSGSNTVYAIENFNSVKMDSGESLYVTDAENIDAINIEGVKTVSEAGAQDAATGDVITLGSVEVSSVILTASSSGEAIEVTDNVTSDAQNNVAQTVYTERADADGASLGGYYVNSVTAASQNLAADETSGTTVVSVDVTVTRSVIAETVIEGENASTSDLTVDSSLNEAKADFIAGAYAVSGEDATGAELTIDASYSGSSVIYAGYSDGGEVSGNTIILEGGESGEGVESDAKLYGCNDGAAESSSGNALTVNGGSHTVAGVYNFDTVTAILASTDTAGVRTATLIATEAAENINQVVMSVEGEELAASDAEAGSSVTLGTLTLSDNIVTAVTDTDGNVNVTSTIANEKDWYASQMAGGGLYVNEIENGVITQSEGEEEGTMTFTLTADILTSAVAGKFIDEDGSSVCSENYSDSVCLTVDDNFNGLATDVFAGTYDVSGEGVSGSTVVVAASYSGDASVYAGVSAGGVVTDSTVVLEEGASSAARLYGSDSYSEGAGNTLEVTGGDNAASGVSNFNTVEFSSFGSSLIATESAENIGEVVITATENPIVAEDRDVTSADDSVIEIGRVTVSDNIYEAVGEDGVKAANAESLEGWYTAERSEGGLYINEVDGVSVGVVEEGTAVTIGGTTYTDTTDIVVTATVALSVIASSFTDEEGNTTAASRQLVVDSSLDSAKSTVIAGAYAAGESAAEDAELTVDASYSGKTSVYAGYSESGSVSGNTLVLAESAKLSAALFGYNDSAASASGNTLVVDGENSAAGVSNFNMIEMDDGESLYADSAENIDGLNISNVMSAQEVTATDIASGTVITLGSVSVSSVILDAISDSDNVTDNITSDAEGNVAVTVYDERTATGFYVNELSAAEQNTAQDEDSSTSVVSVDVTVDRSAIAASVVDGGVTYTNGDFIVDSSLDDIDSDLITGAYGVDGSDITGATLTVSADYSGDADIYAGYTDGGEVASSSVILEENAANNANIYGCNEGATGSDNSIYVYGGNTVNSVSGFDTVYFYNVSANSETASLTVLNEDGAVSDLSGSAYIVSLASGVTLTSGDTLYLIEGDVTGGDNTATIQVGISTDLDVDVKYDETGLLLDLSEAEASASEQTEIVTQSRAASIALVGQGADLMLDSLSALAWDEDTEKGLKVFAAAEGGSSRYATGSHVDVHGWNFIAGVGDSDGVNGGDLVWAVFFESGNAKYSTFSGDVRGDGETVYNGGGVMARYSRYSGKYYEASVRAGMLKNDLSDSLVDRGTGEAYGFDTDTAYYGAHVGIGQLYELDDGVLDAYAKYIYTHHDSESFTVAQEDFSVKSADSSRLKLGLRYSAPKENKWQLYAGAAWEHEFDGKARGLASGLKIKEESLKGSTVMGEFGAKFKDGGKWSLDATVKGYAGERDGFSARLHATYSF